MHELMERPVEPKLRATACLVECFGSAPGRLVFYFDVYDCRTGFTLRNIIAECEKGVWVVAYGHDAKVRWDDCRPLASMNAPSPQYSLAAECRAEFEQALINEARVCARTLFLLARYHSHFDQGFEDAARAQDFEDRYC
jgi:hypothetical protein